MNEYRFQAQINRIAPVGLVPSGLRMNLGFAGTLASVALPNMAIEGTCYLVIRHDGIGVINAHELVIDSDGAVAVSINAGGYVVPPMPIPDLAVVADPTFQWPDVDLAMRGWTCPQSGRADLTELNHAVFAFLGTINMATGALNVAARRVSADLFEDTLAR